ncbi:MAG: SDR family oxidoreductase [Candidatus Bathyarchaeota archaeon]|nr:SDR family oxidoreductase [Candidatus Bathyarchaeota archaeon]
MSKLYSVENTPFPFVQVKNTAQMLKYDLEGKIAIVTGAANGMGEATAKKLAAHGATIIANDVNSIERVAQEIEISKGKIIDHKADVSDYSQVEKMVEKTVSNFGRVDILVNNAGILRRNSIEHIDDAEWDLIMNVNVKGVFNCCKAVLPYMKMQRYGKIVNVSSSAGRSISELGGAHYTASKAAVLGFTRHLAKEAAPFNINVNSICPGLIDTPMIRETTSEEEIKKWIKSIPMKRLGRTNEEAELVLFLVSEASSYINGATIDLNGASLLI